MSSTLEEEWTSMFPIGAVFRSPLLLSGRSARDLYGPLILNPLPSSLTCLFSSPSLLPALSPPPILNLCRFLFTSATIIPSTSSSITSLLGEQPPVDDGASTLRYNRLQFLRCPNTNNVIVFFPTGSNSNNVGFLVITRDGSYLSVHTDRNNEVFSVESVLCYQIFGIAVNPIADWGNSSSDLAGDSYVDIGYLLAYTMYSVEWFIVKTSTTDSSTERVSLVSVGSKVFKTCSIIHACWSPHLPEQSVVLLENGSLFLFDVEPFLKTKNRNANVHFKGKRLRVSWDGLDFSLKVKWLSCEFSWHPEILIVAHSDAVFLVDLREDKHNISCLVKIEMFHTYSLTEKEQFLAFSKVGSDGYFFSVASNSLLLLCDVRKSMPVLQWSHGLEDPSYLNVFSLSELRSNTDNDMYKLASESGYCIILGSFWSCEFNTFCYGPTFPAFESISSKSSKFFQSLYAWDLPSNLLLSGRGCPCGSCLVREETLKDAIPEWVEWQQKKEIVLGFGILDSGLALPFPGKNEHGGFTLIRLMSSGTLEAQNYQASWDSLKRIEEYHKESLDLTNNLLYGWLVDEKYRFQRRFRYLNFECLMGYLNDNLDEVLDSYMRKYCKSSVLEQSSIPEIHEILCQKLKACGLGRFRSSSALTVVFNDISLPTNIEEVALRKLWASLPISLLQLAFSSYSEFVGNKNAVSLEFSRVPDLPQLPPFMLRDPSSRSNKWTRKVQRSDDLVGPLLPLPVLLVLHEFRNGCSKLEEEEAGKFSLEAELGQQYDQIKRVAGELAVSHFDSKVDDPDISLADDRDYACAGSQKPKSCFLYHPSAFDCNTLNNMQGSSIHSADVFDSFIFKLEGGEPNSSDKSENASEELYDGLCPIVLKFDARPMNFGPQEMKAYSLLKRQLLKWEDSFDSYKEFRAKI